MFNSITGIIPARAGSLRIPNKNSLQLNGYPIISYSIVSAKLSGCFDKVVVASDDEDICKIGAEYGADLVVKRNSQDATVSSLDIDWLRNLQKSGFIETKYKISRYKSFKKYQKSSDVRKTIYFIHKCQI